MTTPHSTKQPLVLIAEDDDLLREWLSLNLEILGFSIQVAENGKVAVEKFGESLPDIVLLDVNMPIMGGFDACLEIKNKVARS